MNPAIPAYKAKYQALLAMTTLEAVTDLRTLADLCAAEVPVLAANCVEAADDLEMRLLASAAHHGKANVMAPIPEPPAPKPIAVSIPSAKVDGVEVFEAKEKKAPRKPRGVFALVVYGNDGAQLDDDKCNSRSVAVHRLAGYAGAARGEITGPDGRTEHLSREQAMRDAEGHSHNTVCKLTGTKIPRQNRGPRSWYGATITGG